MPVIDTHGHFLKRILSGQEVQGNFKGHIADGNSHLNAYGQRFQLAAAIEQAMQEIGWSSAGLPVTSTLGLENPVAPDLPGVSLIVPRGISKSAVRRISLDNEVSPP